MLDMILSTILNGKQVNTTKPRVIIRFINKKHHNTDYHIESACEGATTWGRGSGRGSGPPQHFHRPLDFRQRSSNMEADLVHITNINVFLCFLSEMSIISRFSFQLYTKLNDLKFEIPKKILGWGSSSSTLFSSYPRFGHPNFWSEVAPLIACIVSLAQNRTCRFYIQWENRIVMPLCMYVFLRLSICSIYSDQHANLYTISACPSELMHWMQNYFRGFYNV